MIYILCTTYKASTQKKKCYDCRKVLDETWTLVVLGQIVQRLCCRVITVLLSKSHVIAILLLMFYSTFPSSNYNVVLDW